jgi:hypothetical protein
MFLLVAVLSLTDPKIEVRVIPDVPFVYVSLDECRKAGQAVANELKITTECRQVQIVSKKQEAF